MYNVRYLAGHVVYNVPVSNCAVQTLLGDTQPVIPPNLYFYEHYSLISMFMNIISWGPHSPGNEHSAVAGQIKYYVGS